MRGSSKKSFRSEPIVKYKYIIFQFSENRVFPIDRAFCSWAYYVDVHCCKIWHSQKWLCIILLRIYNLFGIVLPFSCSWKMIQLQNYRKEFLFEKMTALGILEEEVYFRKEMKDILEILKTERFKIWEQLTPLRTKTEGLCTIKPN